MNAETARRWVKRWDAQQERYIADREERFRVVVDVVTATVGEVDRPRVVDLACGPGSLSDRLAAALPTAEVVGVDVDPLLLGLASADARPNARFHRADLASADWADEIGLTEPWDAVVSSTALHWLAPDDLARVYATAADRLRPGGVLVNADHLHLTHPRLDALAAAVREGRARRAGVEDNEEWRPWWNALAADPELAPFVDSRSDAAIAHSAENGLSVAQHVDLLTRAGFTAAAPVWQFGDDHVLVAIR